MSTPEWDESVGREVVNVLQQIGLTDEEIVDAALFDSRTVTPIEAIRARAEGYGGLVNNEAVIIQDILSEAPQGISSESRINMDDIERQLNEVLGVFDYSIEFRSLDGDKLNVLFKNHPKAFHIALTHPDGFEDMITFRFPPGNQSYKNYHALAEVLNQNLLGKEHLSLVSLPDFIGNHYQWYLFEDAPLQMLQRQYGSGLSVFEKPIIQEGPYYEDIFEGYDPGQRIHHENEFGEEEPPETIKIEKMPEAAPHIPIFGGN